MTYPTDYSAGRDWAKAKLYGKQGNRVLNKRPGHLMLFTPSLSAEARSTQRSVEILRVTPCPLRLCGESNPQSAFALEAPPPSQSNCQTLPYSTDSQGLLLTSYKLLFTLPFTHLLWVNKYRITDSRLNQMRSVKARTGRRIHGRATLSSPICSVALAYRSPQHPRLLVQHRKRKPRIRLRRQ